MVEENRVYSYRKFVGRKLVAKDILGKFGEIRTK